MLKSCHWLSCQRTPGRCKYPSPAALTGGCRWYQSNLIRQLLFALNRRAHCTWTPPTHWNPAAAANPAGCKPTDLVADAAALASPSYLAATRYCCCGVDDDPRRRGSNGGYCGDHWSGAVVLRHLCAAVAENDAAAPTPTSAGPAAAQPAGTLRSTAAPTRQPVANTTAPGPYLSPFLPQWWRTVKPKWWTRKRLSSTLVLPAFQWQIHRSDHRYRRVITGTIYRILKGW